MSKENEKLKQFIRDIFDQYSRDDETAMDETINNATCYLDELDYKDANVQAEGRLRTL